MSKYWVAAKDPRVSMNLRKVLGESAARLIQGLANSVEKRFVAVAAFKTYCSQRRREVCVLIASVVQGMFVLRGAVIFGKVWSPEMAFTVLVLHSG